MESCDNGDRDTDTEAATTTTQKITATLLACLEHVLLDKPSVSQSHGTLISEPRNEDEISKTWKPGKVAEIMERFRKGELVVVESSKGANVNNSVMPLAVAHVPTKSSSTRPNVNCDHVSEKISSVRRPFRPPSRRPVIENPSDDEPCQNSVVGSRSTDVQKPVSQGLFTTHAQVSSSSSSSNFPTTTFNFQAGHKRFHSNARSFLEKRSCKIRSKLPRDEEDEEMPQPSSNLSTDAKAAEAEISTSLPFRSAYEFMITEDMARGIKRSLPPPAASQNNGSGHKIRKIAAAATKNGNDEGLSDNPEVNLLMLDERLKNVEPKMVEAILNEVVELGASTDWNDIAGLEGVKAIIREIIIWPMQRPDLFTGLRGPPKGILLFGPPGTGKTMFGRLIATKSSSTFFNISASSLMSKWCGDGEKMVRALFQVARVKQPSVVFIDEIDSILTQRSDSEHETSRRLKTEFLLQFDGCGTKSDDKLLVIGVSNRPQELDEAARRRLVKRIYIPLPEPQGRRELVRNLLADQQTSFTEEDYDKVVSLTEGYSGADMASLCKEASYGPIRDIGHDILQVEVASIRPIQFSDFEHAVKRVKASVDPKDLMQFENWDQQFGCHV